MRHPNSVQNLKLFPVRLLAFLVLFAAAASAYGLSFVSSSSARASSREILPDPSGPSHPRRCGPSAAHTLMANGVARVYTLNGIVYGCSRTTGKRSRLGYRDGCFRAERAGPVTLTGQLVAYGLQTCNIDTAFSRVVVRRLSDGKRLTSADALTGPSQVESLGSVDSLVLKRDGAVAWTADDHSPVPHGRRTQVQGVDKNGQALLDSGNTIKASSLRLHGSTLTWKHGAMTRTATLH